MAAQLPYGLANYEDNVLMDELSSVTVDVCLYKTSCSMEY